MCIFVFNKNKNALFSALLLKELFFSVQFVVVVGWLFVCLFRPDITVRFTGCKKIKIKKLLNAVFICLFGGISF